MAALIALIVLLIIIAVAVWAYMTCKLNRVLPKAWLPKECPEITTDRSKFVGAMGQHAYLVPLAFPESKTWMLNRGNYA